MGDWRQGVEKGKLVMAVRFLFWGTTKLASPFASDLLYAETVLGTG